jgi:hypothetical protein
MWHASTLLWETRRRPFPGSGRPISPVQIECPPSGWIPDSTRCEAIRASLTSCGASALPNKRHSRVLASLEATAHFPKTLVPVATLLPGTLRRDSLLTEVSVGIAIPDGWSVGNPEVILGRLSLRPGENGRETPPRTRAHTLTMSVYYRSRGSLTQNKVRARHKYPRINLVRP